MKLLSKLACTSIALLACAALCLPASAQNVTIVDFGSSNDANATFEDADGNPFPDGQNVPYPETIAGTLATDPAPVVFNGPAPNDQNPFNVVVGADPLLETDAELGTQAEIEAAVLSDGATLEWTNATSWNFVVAGHAGESFFAAVEDFAPTTFTITTANPMDEVTVEAIGSWERDGMVTFGGTSAIAPLYNPPADAPGWTFIGTSIGTSTGTLSTGNIPGGGAPEGNVGAFRITITPAADTGGPVLKGDVDTSGMVDFDDIPAFISVLQSGDFQAEADADCDMDVDFDDIPAFILILQGG